MSNSFNRPKVVTFMLIFFTCCIFQALADAMRTIGLKPNWPKPHYQLGLIYKFLGDFKSAVQSFRTALELETDPPPSLVALTLKAETVLAMPTTDRSSTIKQDMPSPTVLSFQPSGSPLPRAKPDFFSGLHLAIPHGDGDVDSPLCSPSGGEEVSPFSFSSGDSLEVQVSKFTLQKFIVFICHLTHFAFLLRNFPRSFRNLYLH